MSRHRNVRTLNYDEDFFDEDDVYGHSVEDNYCISPGTAAQFTFNRDRNVDLSNFLGEEGGIPEEDEEVAEEGDGTPRDNHRHSLDYTRPQLNDVDEARLNSCLEEVRNVLGESVPEHIMVDTIMKQNFDLEKSLNQLLSQQDAPKPQREPRQRRNRSQEFDEDNLSTSYPSSGEEFVFSDNPISKGGLLKFGTSASPQSPLLVKYFKHKIDAQDKEVDQNDNVKETKSKPKEAESKFNETQSKFNLPHSNHTLKSEHSGSQNVNNLNNAQSQSLKQNTYPLTSETSKSGITLSGPTQLTADVTKLSLSSLSKCQNSSKKSASKGSLSLADLAAKHGSSCMNRSQDSKSSLSEQVQKPESIHQKSKQINMTLSDLASQQNLTQNRAGRYDPKSLGPMPLNTILSQKVTKKSGSGSLLSDLASSPPANNSQNIIRNSGPSLAGIVGTSPLSLCNKSGSTSPSLSDLAAKHNSPSGSNAPKTKTECSALTKLASKHEHQYTQAERRGVSLATLALVHQDPSSGSLAGKGIISSISSTSDSLKPEQKSQGLSLTHEEKMNGNKNGYEDNTLNKDSGFSLSDLAKAHGVSPGHGTSVSGDVCSVQNQTLKTGQSVSGLSLLTKPDRTDKTQIMLSLSSLVEKHDQTKTVGGGHHLDKPPSFAKKEATKSSKPTLKAVRQSASQEPKVSSQVPKVSSQEPKVTSQEPKVSLAELARKKSSPKIGENKRDKNKSRMAALEHIQGLVDTVPETDKENVAVDVEIKLSEAEFFSRSSAACVRQLISRPSSVGKTLCVAMVSTKSAGQVRYKMRKFSYKYQMRNITDCSPARLKEIVPFDFNTPSPDEIVKSRQKLAFNRTGERAERKISD